MELASFLPVLILVSMSSVDFARVCFVHVALQNAARNGAIYAFYTKAGLPLPSGWTSLSTAANADAPSGMTFTASATSPGSSTNNTVTVTVTTTYSLLALSATGAWARFRVP